MIRKRLFALLISVAMVIALIPAAAFADTAGAEAEDAAAAAADRGDPVSMVFEHNGDYMVKGYTCTQEWDSENMVYVDVPAYNRFNVPNFTWGDKIKVKYENSPDEVVYNSNGSNWFQSVEDWTDSIYPLMTWANEQSYENPFEPESYQDICISLSYTDGNGESQQIATYTPAYVYMDWSYGGESPGYGDPYEFGELPEESSVPSIDLDEMVDVSLTDSAPIATFKFTAPQTRRYVFEAFGDVNTDLIARIPLKDGTSYLWDDDGIFKLYFDAQAGTTYYLQTKAFKPGNYSFKAMVYIESWVAQPKRSTIRITGGSSEFEVVTKGFDEGLTYDWYRTDGQPVKHNGEKILPVSEVGEYYCLVSDGIRSQRVNFEAYVPELVIGDLCFYALDNNSSTAGSYNPIKGAVNIPSSVTFADGKTRKVTVIDSFDDCKEMTYVGIPNTVTTIESYAFAYIGLKSITIPASVTSIGKYALGYDEVKTSEKDEDGDYIYRYVVIPGFVIYGTTGSAAEKYAKANGITFIDPQVTRPGAAATAGGASYQVLTNASVGVPGTVAYTKAPNKKSVAVPDAVVINNMTFKVTSINANAFKGKKIRTVTIGANVSKIVANAFKKSKATRMIVKSRLLKKAGVKKSLKGSKIKTVQVKVGSKKDNKKFVKSYKKIFTKANAGAKVTVK